MNEKEKTKNFSIQTNKLKFDLQERFIDYAVRGIEASLKVFKQQKTVETISKLYLDIGYSNRYKIITGILS